MKLLLVTPEFPPDRGGIATYLGALFSGPPCGRDTVRVHKISWESLNAAWWIYPRWMPAFFSIARACMRERPDILCVSHVLPLGTSAYILSFFTKIPYVIFFHGTDLLNGALYKKRKVLVRWISADARCVFVNSMATQDLYTKIYGAHTPAHVLYPGISVPHTEHAVREHIRTTYALENTFTIIFLGRLVERKGADEAVRAVHELRGAYPHIRLFILGDGPQRETVRARITELNMGDITHMVHNFSESEKWAWLSLAQALVFPYHSVPGEWEGFGISALEAQAVGCPVIATAREGLQEAFVPGVTGNALQTGSVPELIVALKKFLDDEPTRRSMSDAARTHATRFSITTMRKNFDTIIHAFI